jgi:O-antigen ligase
MQRVGRSTLAQPAVWPQAPVGNVADAVGSVNVRPWVLLALVFFISQTFSRLGDVFPLIQPIRPGLLSQAAFVLVLLQRQSQSVLKAAMSHTPTVCVAILATLAVVTVPAGAWPGASFKYLKDVYYASLFLFAAGALAFSRGQTRRAVILAVTILASVVSVQSLLSANRWRFEIGMTYDPNVTAAYLVMVVPWVAGWAALERDKLLKLIPLAAIPLLAMTIVRTGSRGGILGFLVLIPFLYSISPPRRRGLVTLMIVGISAILSLTAQRQLNRLRSTLFDKTDYNYTHIDGRMMVWGRGMSYVKEKPFTGHGINGFRYRELAWKIQTQGGGRETEAHNMFLEVAVDLGVVGFGTFVTAFIASIAGVIKLRRRAKQRFRVTGDRGDEELAVYGGAAAASLTSLLITGFFLSVGHQAPVYFGLGAAMGMILSERFRSGGAGPGIGSPDAPTLQTNGGGGSGWRSRKSALQWRLRHESARSVR